MGVDAEMFVRVPRALTAADVWAESIRIAKAFGAHSFFVRRPSTWTDSQGIKHVVAGHHAMSIVGSFEQDGPTIFPDAGETFVRVHLYGRFYGIGYERGDLVNILGIARWLRTAFSSCSIWYGGDSSGEVAQELNDNYERQLWDHFFGASGRAYFDFRKEARLKCDFCKVDCNEIGGGGDRTFFYCSSCGQHWNVYSNGRVEATDSHEHREDQHDVPLRDAMPVLLDALAMVSIGNAKITKAIVGNAGDAGSRLSLEIQGSVRGLTDDQRVEYYERASLDLMAKYESLTKRHVP